MTSKKRDLFNISELATQITPYRGDRISKCIRNYISECQDRFSGNPEDDRLLVQMLLRDEAREWLEDCRQKPEWTQLSGQEVLDRLKKAFFPPNYAQYAIRTLLRSNRGSNSLAVYLSQFNELKMDIPEEDLTDIILCYYLTEGCGEPYATDLRRDGIYTYPEVYEYLQRQANTLTHFPGHNTS